MRGSGREENAGGVATPPAAHTPHTQTGAGESEREGRYPRRRHAPHSVSEARIARLLAGGVRALQRSREGQLPAARPERSCTGAMAVSGGKSIEDLLRAIDLAGTEEQDPVERSAPSPENQAPQEDTDVHLGGNRWGNDNAQFQNADVLELAALLTMIDNARDGRVATPSSAGGWHSGPPNACHIPAAIQDPCSGTLPDDFVEQWNATHTTLTPLYEPKGDYVGITTEMAIPTRETLTEEPDRETDTFQTDEAANAYVKYATKHFRNTMYIKQTENVLEESLLRLPEAQSRIAVEINKVLCACTQSDRPPEFMFRAASFWLNKTNMLHELANELILQLCRVTYQNDNSEAVNYAWRMMGLMLGMLVPSGDLFGSLIKYIGSDCPPEKAPFFETRLWRTHTNGCRKEVSTLDVSSYEQQMPIILEADLADGTTVAFEVDGAAIAGEVVQMIGTHLGLKSTEGYVLIAQLDGTETRLQEDDHVLDVVGKFESVLAERASAAAKSIARSQHSGVASIPPTKADDTKRTMSPSIMSSSPEPSPNVAAPRPNTPAAPRGRSAAPSVPSTPQMSSTSPATGRSALATTRSRPAPPAPAQNTFSALPAAISPQPHQPAATSAQILPHAAARPQRLSAPGPPSPQAVRLSPPPPPPAATQPGHADASAGLSSLPGARLEPPTSAKTAENGAAAPPAPPPLPPPIFEPSRVAPNEESNQGTVLAEALRNRKANLKKSSGQDVSAAPDIQPVLAGMTLPDGRAIRANPVSHESELAGAIRNSKATISQAPQEQATGALPVPETLTPQLRARAPQAPAPSDSPAVLDPAPASPQQSAVSPHSLAPIKTRGLAPSHSEPPVPSSPTVARTRAPLPPGSTSPGPASTKGANGHLSDSVAPRLPASPKARAPAPAGPVQSVASPAGSRNRAPAPPAGVTNETTRPEVQTTASPFLSVSDPASKARSRGAAPRAASPALPPQTASASAFQTNLPSGLQESSPTPLVPVGAEVGDEEMTDNPLANALKKRRLLLAKTQSGHFAGESGGGGGGDRQHVPTPSLERKQGVNASVPAVPVPGQQPNSQQPRSRAPPPPPPPAPPAPPIPIPNWASVPAECDGRPYPWKIHFQRGFVYPTHDLTDPVDLRLASAQIMSIADRQDPAYPKEDLERVLAYAAANQLNYVVLTALQWPLYFGQKFSAKEPSFGPRKLELVIDHRGVHICDDRPQGQKQILLSCSYDDLVVGDVQRDSIELHLNELKYQFETNGKLVKAATEAYVKPMREAATKGVTLCAYTARDSNQLTFEKGVLVDIVGRDLGSGWFSGRIGDSTGWLPMEAVEPLLDHPQYTADGRPRMRAAAKARSEALEKSLAASAAAAAAEASNIAEEAEGGGAPEDGTAEVSPMPSESYPDSGEKDTKFTMLEYSKRYFVQDLAKGGIKEMLGRTRSPSRKGEAEWGWSNVVQKIKFSDVPLKAPLTKIIESADVRLMLEANQNIMGYMGDLPLRKSAAEAVQMIIFTGMERDHLRDEIYCQIVKQTTSNKSRKSDSCRKGWTLMLLCCTFLPASAKMEPYLRNHLRRIACDKGRDFHDEAAEALSRLARTKASPRSMLYPPSVAEIKAIETSEQMSIEVRLPDETTMKVDIDSYTTSLDVMKTIAPKFGIPGPAEYCLRIHGSSGLAMVPIAPSDKVLDAINIADSYLEKCRQQGFQDFGAGPHAVWFRRKLWTEDQLKTHMSEELLTFLFRQLAEEFLNGSLVSAAHLASPAKPVLADLAVFMSRGRDIPMLTSSELRKFIPALVYDASPPAEWEYLYKNSVQTYPAIESTEAKMKFIEHMKRTELLGSACFEVKIPNEPRSPNSSLMAVNRQGIRVFDYQTRELVFQNAYVELVNFRYEDDEFVMRIGDASQKRIVKLKTRQGFVIADVVNSNFEIYSSRQ